MLQGSTAAVTNAEYFHGRVNREDAERILFENGFTSGLFLLRESTKKNGHYAISLCFNNIVYHYCIEPQEDGTVLLDKMMKFSNPIDTVNYYMKNQGGLVCKLEKPCCKSRILPHFLQIGEDAIEKLIEMKAKEWGIENESLQMILSKYGSQFKDLVKKSLHESQPWFHGLISRTEAENRLKMDGKKDGKFLIREREDHTFALCLCYNSLLKHYKIDILTNNKLAIQNGKQFENIMELVEHYAIWKDGLWCELKEICPKDDAGDDYSKHNIVPKKDDAKFFIPKSFNIPIPKPRTRNTNLPSSLNSPPVPSSPSSSSPGSKPIPKPRKKKMYNPNLAAVEGSNKSGRSYTDPVLISKINKTDDVVLPHPPPRRDSFPSTINPSFSNAEYLELADTEEPASKCDNSVFLSATNSKTGAICNEYDFPEEWTDPAGLDNLLSESLKLMTSSGEDSVTVFKRYQERRKTPFKLNREHIVLHEILGSGNFGQVMRGSFVCNNTAINLAVKVLKTNEIPSSVTEMLKEAENMSGLDHPNIVRLIGYCLGEQILLIMELAPLGPINKYLKKHKDFAITYILELMVQVAKGMEYLSCVKFIHRDLAARNVLLVNEHFAKISDFGMSQALGLGSDYYRAKEGGKWPLKWYAPECIYYYKFSLKSDVWSYGVTLWEVFTYGQKPYQGMVGLDILKFIESGSRLNKPEACPEFVYDVMNLCWSYEAKDRPSFSDIVRMMNHSLTEEQITL